MRYLAWAAAILIILPVLLAVNSLAIPTCTFRTSCNAGETCIFEVFQENNSHVGNCDSDYTTKICCTELSNVTVRSNSCNSREAPVLSMYQTSNSHAAFGLYYSNVVCANTSSNQILMNLRSSCTPRETCAATFFQNNNTHVGRCGYFANSLCIQEHFAVTITMILNSTSPNWNDVIQLQGVASRSDGTFVNTSGNLDVTVYVNSSTVCQTDTNSSGGYTCNFTAPQAVGLYNVNVTISDPTAATYSNSTTFTVKQTFGETKEVEESVRSISCYEEPRIIQNADGTIEVATIRICVFR